jgi:hypothetical protein
MKSDTTRDKNTAWRWIKAPVSLMIIRGSKINIWEEARCKLVRSTGGDVGKS